MLVVVSMLERINITPFINTKATPIDNVALIGTTFAHHQNNATKWPIMSSTRQTI